MTRTGRLGRTMSGLAGALALAVALTACGSATDAPATTAAASATSESAAPAATTAASTEVAAVPDGTPATVEDAAAGNAATHLDEADLEWDPADETAITLTGETTTITEPGTYRVTGSISDGQLVIDSSASGLVRVILDGVDISSSSSAAVLVAEADEVMIVLADGSTNTLSDADSYAEDAEVNAALFSTAPLTITGTGALTVTGNGNDGITSKDGLVIDAGAITVTAADDAVRGKDYLVVRDGTLVLTAGGDGLSSDNDSDASLGYVLVEGGSITIDAELDGIQAFTDVILAAGTVDITAGDDGVNAGTLVFVADPSITVTAGGDGIHSDLMLVTTGGDIDVAGSTEGLEAVSMTIAGGVIDVVATDDGINIAGEVTDASAYLLTLTGGTVNVTAQGDGLDANGSIAMSGGTLTITGPTSDGNGAIDFDGSFDISGGTLLALGSSGMAMAPDASSAQASILAALGTAYPAGSVVTVLADDGAAAGDVHRHSGASARSHTPTRRWCRASRTPSRWTARRSGPPWRASTPPEAVPEAAVRVSGPDGCRVSPGRRHVLRCLPGTHAGAHRRLEDVPAAGVVHEVGADRHEVLRARAHHADVHAGRPDDGGLGPGCLGDLGAPATLQAGGDGVRMVHGERDHGGDDVHLVEPGVRDHVDRRRGHRTAVDVRSAVDGDRREPARDRA